MLEILFITALDPAYLWEAGLSGAPVSVMGPELVSHNHEHRLARGFEPNSSVARRVAGPNGFTSGS